MKTIQQQRVSWNRFRRNLPELAKALATSYAETGVTLRKEESIDKGINKDGKEGQKVKYSQKTVPSFYLQGKELNSRGRDYVENNKQVNWYGLRKAQGLPSENVNLSYSNKTWSDYRVLEVTITNGIITAKVGLSLRADIFQHNVERYGKFYLNTPKELAQMRADVERESRNWLIQSLS